MYVCMYMIQCKCFYLLTSNIYIYLSMDEVKYIYVIQSEGFYYYLQLR